MMYRFYSSFLPIFICRQAGESRTDALMRCVILENNDLQYNVNSVSINDIWYLGCRCYWGEDSEVAGYCYFGDGLLCSFEKSRDRLVYSDLLTLLTQYQLPTVAAHSSSSREVLSSGQQQQ